MSATPWRITVWVESLLGYGHVLRALKLLAYFDGCERQLITGSALKQAFVPQSCSGMQVVELPGLHLDDPQGDLASDDGNVEEVLTERAELAWAAMRTFRPNVFITEHFPFGRWGFRRELIELLVRTREELQNCLIMASVRDIPQGDDRPPGYGTTVAGILECAFDGVIIHGEPGVIDARNIVPELRGLDVPVVFGGYLMHEAAPGFSKDGPVVLDLGGGWAAAPVCTALMRLLNETTELVVVGGSKGVGAITGRPKTRVVQDALKLGSAAAKARIYIGRGGYNTCAGVLGSNVPAIIVPHEFSREQQERATALVRIGRVVAISEQELMGCSPELFDNAVKAARRMAETWHPIRCQGNALPAVITAIADHAGITLMGARPRAEHTFLGAV